MPYKDPKKNAECKYRWYRQNQSLCRRRAFKWRKKNHSRVREREKVYGRTYRQKHPERLAARNAARRAIVGYATRAVVKIYERAKELRQWFDVEVDHKIPISKGGKHTPDNLQIIYKQENQKKGTTLNFVPSVVFI